MTAAPHVEYFRRVTQNIFGYEGTPEDVRRDLRDRTAEALEGRVVRGYDVRKHIVHVVDHWGNSFSSGLMLTANGLILTTYHSIQESIDDWERCAHIARDMSDLHEYNQFEKRYKVFDREGDYFHVDPTFFVVDPEHDLAIMKAVMIAEPECLRPPIADIDDDMMLFSFEEDHMPAVTLVESFDAGFEDRMTPDTLAAIIFDDYNIHSGGPAMTPDGLGGVLIGSARHRDTRLAIISKGKYVQKLLNRAAERLREL